MIRKLFLVIAIVALTVTASQKVEAQEFEGKMTLTIEYEEVPEEYEPYISMFPKESILYVKGKKTRIEQNTMGGSNITIMDSETNKGFMIMNAMGQKAAYELDGTQDKKEDAKKPTVTLIDEKKVISGYNCKKASVKFDEEEDPIIVWYTDEITGVYNPQYSNLEIKGSIMEYSVKAQGMEMKMTITHISKEKVADDKFTVPAGYEVKPYSEMLKMAGGQGDK